MQDKYHDYHFQEHGNHAHDLPAHRHVQENAEDILAEAKQINEERAAKEAALEQEAEEVTEETVADNTDFAEEA